MVDFGFPRKIVNFQPSQKMRFEGNSGLQIQQLPMSSCARSTLTHQLLEELNSSIPTLPKSPQKKAISEKWGFRIDNPVRTVFLQFLSEQLVFKGGNY
jgi:hypothetical protein